MRPMRLSMRLLLVACVVARAVALPPGVADSVWQTPPPAVVGLASLPYCAIRLGQYQPSWRDRLTLAPLRFAFAQPPPDTNIVLPADEAKSSSIPDMPAAAEIQAAMDKPKQKFTLPMLSRKAQPMAPVLVSYSILKSNQSNNSPFSPYHSCLSLSARYISH